MKKLFVSLSLLAALLVALALPAQAGDTSTVSASVTVLNLSLTVSDATIAYGVRVAGLVDAVPSPAYVTVTNNGNVQEKFSIKGQNTAAWTLSNVAGSEQYVHKFAQLAGDPFVAMTTNPTQFATVPLGNNVQVYLKMDLPTSTTASAQQNAVVTFLATQ